MSKMTTGSFSSPLHSTQAISVVEAYSLMVDGRKSSSDGSSRFSAFIVRFTDASSKALNQAVTDAKQKGAKGDGYIELGNRDGGGIDGTLCFGGTCPVSHRFSLMDIQRDLGPKGQLDVIEQQRNSIGNKCGGVLKSVGPVNQRIQISATTEDTFQSTKQKTQQANQELRKNAPKVVMKGPGTGGAAMKVWQKINKVQTATSQRPLTPLSHQHQKITNGNGNGKIGNGHISNGLGLGDISKRPLRQRLMYRLLANPGSSSDLLTKLANEGMSEHDRSIFGKTLNELGQISNPSDSSSPIYELKRSFYSDIRLDDWPFYNSWERQACRKKLLMHKNGSSGDHHSNSNGNGQNGDNSGDCTQRVNGKVSYRPPPKKPPKDNSPKNPNLINSNISSAPSAVPISAASPGSSCSVPSPVSPTRTANANGTNGRSNRDHEDSTQRVSAKSVYRPAPPKKPAVNSPSPTSLNGKSPPVGPVACGKSPPNAPSMISDKSPPPAQSLQSYPKTTPATPAVPTPVQSPPSSLNSSKTAIALSSISTEHNPASPAPPPKKKAHIERANGGHAESVPVRISDEEQAQMEQRKHRKQHGRPALATSNGLTGLNPANGDEWKLAEESAIDYAAEYPAISSAVDRRRYKDEFDRDYPMYLKLYDRLQLTAEEFENLGERLKRANKESSEYRNIEREILVKYYELQRDVETHRTRREHERLRKKLGVIKERVKEYDEGKVMTPWINGNKPR